MELIASSLMRFCDHDTLKHKKRSNTVTGILFVIGGDVIKPIKGSCSIPFIDKAIQLQCKNNYRRY
jgi:hypothetical protein